MVKEECRGNREGKKGSERLRSWIESEGERSRKCRRCLSPVKKKSDQLNEAIRVCKKERQTYRFCPTSIQFLEVYFSHDFPNYNSFIRQHCLVEYESCDPLDRSDSIRSLDHQLVFRRPNHLRDNDVVLRERTIEHEFVRSFVYILLSWISSFSSRFKVFLQVEHSQPDFRIRITCFRIAHDGVRRVRIGSTLIPVGIVDWEFVFWNLLFVER